MMDRIVIQIVGGCKQYSIYALCSDGTIWGKVAYGVHDLTLGKPVWKPIELPPFPTTNPIEVKG